MRITLICVGRLSAAPEAGLAQNYVDRATAAGRSLGLGPVDIVEVAPRKPGQAAENQGILIAADGAPIIACDRRGPSLDSGEFAAWLARLRDQGARRLALAVGGAEGLDAAVLSAAVGKLSFGAQTWPHALARVMLAEQVYRAATILAGSPYHRR